MTTHDHRELEDAVDAATIFITAHPGRGRPYYGRPLAALSRPIWTDSVPTMGVDGRWRLYMNPQLVADLSLDELAGGLVHEINHLLRDHAGRGEALGVTEDQYWVWNLAADLEINQDLLEDGFELPDWSALPSRMGFVDGLTAEEYFRHLLDSDSGAGGSDCDTGPGTGPEGSPCGSCCGPDPSMATAADRDTGTIPNGISASHAEVLRRSTASDIEEYLRGTGPGSVPGGLNRWATDRLRPVVDWRRALSAALRSSAATVAGRADFTYARPSRRSTDDVILAGMASPALDVAVVIDTSASMREAELDRVRAEIDGILRQVGDAGQTIRTLSVDVMVHTIQRVTSSGSIELIGAGGTDMRVGIAEAANLNPRPNIIVVLTDGMTPWPQVPLPIPVVACLVGPAVDRLTRSFQVGSVEIGPPPDWIRTVVVDRP